MTEKVPFSATDRRHSYIQRPHSLAGPGAYSIPSTFCQNATNTLLRAVQREHYGREFARYVVYCIGSGSTDRIDAVDNSRSCRALKHARFGVRIG